MNSRIETMTTISDAVKQLMHEQIKGGWTSERIAHEMQQLGHKGWSAHTPPSLTKAGTRPLTVDETVGLLAVFKSRTQIIAREIDRQVALLLREGGAR